MDEPTREKALKVLEHLEEIHRTGVSKPAPRRELISLIDSVIDWIEADCDAGLKRLHEFDDYYRRLGEQDEDEHSRTRQECAGPR